MADQEVQHLDKPPRRLPISLVASSPTPIVAGVVLCAAGFVLIAICWSQVALRMIVADQVPYIVSGGFTGMGLILVGAMIASIQVRRRDADRQFRRLEELVYRAAGENPPPATRAPRRREGGGIRARVAALREPVVAAMATCVLAVLSGFALLAFAWLQASDEPDVAVQMPYVVSGGLGGLALIAVGAVLAHVLVARVLERERGDLIADVVTAVGPRERRRARRR